MQCSENISTNSKEVTEKNQPETTEEFNEIKSETEEFQEEFDEVEFKRKFIDPYPEENAIQQKGIEELQFIIESILKSESNPN